jgi:C_GCAxxG_C_C family probable redox protein
MSKWHNNHDSQAEALSAQIKKRAVNLYQTRLLLCTEAVVVTLNKALNGGLSDAQAVAVAAPFSVALGDSGCICGAFSGAVLACGLLVGNDQPYHHRQSMRKSARQLHDAFKATNGATCCKVLSRSVRHDRQAHFRQCANLTAGAAEMAARLILNQRPELVQCTEIGFLQKNGYQNRCHADPAASDCLPQNLKRLRPSYEIHFYLPEAKYDI